MKRIKLILGVVVMAVVATLTSCSQSPTEQVVGRWKLEMGGGMRYDVTVNNDGTGEMILSGPGYDGRNMLLMREDATIEEDGNTLIFHFTNGEKAYLTVQDETLYSADSRPFEKI